jgi:hypothetical protein
MGKRAAIVIALILLAGPNVRGDEWRVPTVQNIFSDNGRFFVRLLPGTRPYETECGASGTPKSAGNARGQFYAQDDDRGFRLVADIELRNPISPVYAVVTDSGNLVTFDNWFCMGYGDAIAVYESAGTLVRSIPLSELYPSTFSAIPRSRSGLSWRCSVFVSPSPDPGTIAMFDHRGGAFIVDGQTGRFEYRAGNAPCQPYSWQMF